MSKRKPFIISVGLLLLAGAVFVFKNSQQAQTETSSTPLKAKNTVELDKSSLSTIFKPLDIPQAEILIKKQSTDIVSASKNSANNIKPKASNKLFIAKEQSAKRFKTNTLIQSDQHGQVATTFTKIDFNGQKLPNSATAWSCAKDLKTKLLWETKLFDAGISDVEHRYSWYNPNSDKKGFKNKGSCYGTECDTYAYTQEINRLELCGSKQWRLPTFAELETLLDRNYFNPVINQDIFYNTTAASYWTKTQLENNPKMIMQIDFFNGTSSPAPIHFKLAVRLVSAENE